MSKTLTIGNQDFEFPDQGESAGWGEENAAWASAATDALATVQGPIDILKTQATLLDGSSGDIVGFSLDTTQLISGSAELTITRTYTDATPTEQEIYNILYSYDGATFDAKYESVGTDTGVVVDATNVGQFTYVASSKANTDTIIATFTAKATIN